MSDVVQPFRSSAEFLATYAVKPPGRRKQAKARTLQKVKDAARALFDTLGYDATTMRDVARHTGMSTGAVFASFPDGKDQMWTEVMGCPPPTMHLAEEIARLQVSRPDYRWLLKFDGRDHVAQVQHPDFDPTTPASPLAWYGRAASPGEALRLARLAADKAEGNAK
ncbi:TetR/AcrR family transcriptional regulator [Brevundimonas staleyi]|uniref:TetR/AcrR family transcriptional regulator n=1 Tax=Brevundimonas staleyi TaxID=74326 RepID=A0ABW0FZV1_9CAUL